MPRGGNNNQSRGGNNRRGRGTNFRPTRLNHTVHDRLGARVGEDQQRNKYKLVRNAPITSAIAQVPSEQRIRVISKKFLKTYFEIFDQPGRASLESQYNADAFFSYSATHPMPSIGRNLLLVPQPEKRVSLLLHDKTNIARELAFFPPTEHNVTYLSCDVPYYVVTPMSVSMMQLVVTGVFKDTSMAVDPLRAFTRVFILKLVTIDKNNEPVYEIFNDMFMLQPPTPDQIKRYHQDAQISKNLNQNQDRQAAGTGAATVDRPAKNQREMIQSIMSKTKMNEQGATKLLNEWAWDEAKCLAVFNTLFLENKIPQDLFT